MTIMRYQWKIQRTKYEITMFYKNLSLENLLLFIRGKTWISFFSIRQHLEFGHVYVVL